MDKCDVLLTYEIRNREIENLCLVKRELERRGYSVRVRMQYETFFRSQPPLEAKVVVVPAFYRPRSRFYSSSHTVTTEKILNMQWEQVRSVKFEEDKDNILAIKPWGRVASHIAWGNNMRDRLINEWGVAPDHVFRTGQIALDFLRYPLVNYYEPREAFLAAYDIPADSKVHLFISSLSYADATMRVMRSSSMGDLDTAMEYSKLCSDTRNELLRWFEKALEKSEDSIIVYRPHPEEKGDETLREFAKRQKRFRIINEKSVKQWIIACDRMYTWKSTAIAEVYAAGKRCDILRPLEIPLDNDIRMLHEARHITTYEEFEEAFFSMDQSVRAFSDDKIEEHYYIPRDRFSYELVCDAIETIMKDDRYKIDPPLKNRLAGPVSPERAKNVLKRIIAKSKLCEKLQKSDLMSSGKIRELLDDVFYVKNKLQRNYTSDEELATIMEKIERAFASAREKPTPGKASGAGPEAGTGEGK